MDKKSWKNRESITRAWSTQTKETKQNKNKTTETEQKNRQTKVSVDCANIRNKMLGKLHVTLLKCMQSTGDNSLITNFHPYIFISGSYRKVGLKF